MFTFTLNYDQYTLLLYMLLHRNQHFKMFILSRINIDLLIIPILKVVFNAPNRSSHHIYMALIILLILSEDDLFNKSIHNIVNNLFVYFLIIIKTFLRNFIHFDSSRSNGWPGTTSECSPRSVWAAYWLLWSSGPFNLTWQEWELVFIFNLEYLMNWFF